MEISDNQCIKDYYLMSRSDLCEDFVELFVVLCIVLHVLKLQDLMERLAVLVDDLHAGGLGE